jgi:hypothetical protein
MEIKKKLSNSLMKASNDEISAAFEDDDEFDLDNSDDLNKFISKYEAILENGKEKSLVS